MSRDFTTALLLGLVLSVSGCLSPIGPVNPQPGPGPTPTPVPTPDTAVRRDVAAALSDVPREECVKLYGVFSAIASYVEDGGKGITTTAQLYQLTTTVLDNLRWAKGRYPRLSEVVRTTLNERFRQPVPLDGVRQQVVDTFREIAAGCKDGATK